MTTLDWNELPGGGELASGDDWAYLIAADDRNVVLTRWAPRPGATGGEVARQAALNAIQVGGAYDAVPDAAISLAGHMKQQAQAYESGLDVAGHPAWRHGRNPR